MSHRSIDGVICEFVQGNIADQPDMDAIVNAANAQLRIGGGVAGAIHRAAGAGLQRECRPLAPILPGQAVITGAHGLPNRHVIHCLGPRYWVDQPAADLLTSCYRNALRLAEASGVRSIAFPAISAGAFGYPMAAAARVALKTVADEAPGLRVVGYIRFVLIDESAVRLYERILSELPASKE